MFKKITIWLLAAVFIFIIGGIGGVFFDESLMPRLSSVPMFSNIGFLKHLNDRVTVINKTEQVTVQGDDPLEKVISQSATAVVTVTVSDIAMKQTETMTGVLLTNDGLFAVFSEKPADTKKYRYQAVLFDGSIHQADFVGYDQLTDIDFFRLQGGDNTPAIAFANSDDIRIGKRVIAVSNASADYQSRLAVGVIGDVDRTFNISGKTVASSEKWEGVFRADIVGLEKFVGGPLVDSNGEMQGLIGTLAIDNAIQAFVIPSNAVRDSLDRVIAGTLDKQPYLGAYYLPITKSYALGQGLARDHGALVYSPSGKTGLAVIADSPAAKAGLQAGDIIAAIDGNEITQDDPLPKSLAAFKKGDQIQVLIIRGNEEKTLSVQL